MRNLLLASAFLAAASFSHADDGVVTSQAFDDAPALNAPLSGPAFIDPVFPAKTEDRDEEIAKIDSSEDLPLPDEGARWTLKDASKDLLHDSVADKPETDGVVWLR